MARNNNSNPIISPKFLHDLNDEQVSEIVTILWPIYDPDGYRWQTCAVGNWPLIEEQNSKPLSICKANDRKKQKRINDFESFCFVSGQLRTAEICRATQRNKHYDAPQTDVSAVSF